MKYLALATVAMAAITSATHAQIVELVAVDSKCISSSNENWNDNRLRAYWNNRFVDGFLKFDFSEIPSGAQIISMTLRTYHEEGFNNPFSDPQVQLYRVSDDSWSRGPTNNHPGLGETISAVYNNFPSGSLIPFDWEIDVGAADWSADIADGYLTIVMRNIQTIYSFVYWHGSDATPQPPVLTVEYSTEGVSLRVTGTCPGQITLSWNGATANRQMGIVFSRSTGSYVIPGGPCAGTQLGLGTNQLQLARTIGTGSNGSGQVNGNIGTGACGGYLQLVVVDSPCDTSNVVQLP